MFALQEDYNKEETPVSTLPEDTLYEMMVLAYKPAKFETRFTITLTLNMNLYFSIGPLFIKKFLYTDVTLHTYRRVTMRK